jgi:serine O-acetyltransferase
MAAITPEALGKPHERGCARTLGQLRALLQADLYRYEGRIDAKTFWKHYLFTPGYKYTVLMRTCGFLRVRRSRAFGLYYLAKWLLLRARYKYGIAIPEYTVIGPGLFINRFGGIYINGDVIIGTNANLTHGTMLGQANRGPRAGSPVLGNRVFIGAGAKIVGRIHLGDDCAVGTNAVVTRDVPTGSVVGGIPAKVISEAGSEGYVNRLAPEELVQLALRH